MKSSQALTEKPKGSIGVMIVDDHPVVRMGLAALINQEEDLSVSGQAGEAGEALSLLESVKPDVLVLDISLKNTSGMELLEDIRHRYPDLPILILSIHDEEVFAERSLNAGARGYVMKQEGTAKVLLGIRAVSNGEVFLSQRMSKNLLDKLASGRAHTGESKIKRLSNRELEILELIGGGHGRKQIAERLCVSVKTVESHREHIKEKLLLKNARELLQYAIQWRMSETL